MTTFFAGSAFASASRVAFASAGRSDVPVAKQNLPRSIVTTAMACVGSAGVGAGGAAGNGAFVYGSSA